MPYGLKGDIFTAIGHFRDRVSGVELQYVLPLIRNLNVILCPCRERSRCRIQIKVVLDRADSVGVIDFPGNVCVDVIIIVGAMVNKGLKYPQRDSGCGK